MQQDSGFWPVHSTVQHDVISLARLVLEPEHEALIWVVVAGISDFVHLLVRLQRLPLQYGHSIRFSGDCTCEEFLASRTDHCIKSRLQLRLAKSVVSSCWEVKLEIRVRVRVGLVPKFSQTAYVGRDPASSIYLLDNFHAIAFPAAGASAFASLAPLFTRINRIETSHPAGHLRQLDSTHTAWPRLNLKPCDHTTKKTLTSRHSPLKTKSSPHYSPQTVAASTGKIL